jgi:hypothetical protein
VLLPSDTYRKPITSITSFLLPFVTYLLTLLRSIKTVAVLTGTREKIVQQFLLELFYFVA